MKMENVTPWIRMSLVFGSSATGRRLIAEYGSPEAVLSLAPDLLFGEGKITEYQRGAMEQARWLNKKTERIVSLCRRFNWQILTPENEMYPAQFKKLADCPPVLYAWGDLNALTERRYAAVVGTRSADRIPLIAAYNLGKTLSEHGVVTVSGGAVGIDRAAHEGALAGGGQTVCVLGTGLGADYLPENDFMRRRIARQGAVVTEMPPAEKPTKYSFPRRNRLIAALGETLTVVQSGVAGGSMISADFAVAYQKPLFALSDRVFASPGCERLIGQQEALALESAAQVVSFYGARAPRTPLCAAGEALPKILDAAACMPEEYAALNGVRPAEAYPMYLALTSGAAPAPTPEPERDGQPKPPKKAAKKKAAAPKTPSAGASPAQKTAPPELTGDKKTVYAALSEAPVSMDSLTEATGLSPGKLMSAVTLLELDGLVVLHPGNRISIK